jgi:hypothetical protein
MLYANISNARSLYGLVVPAEIMKKKMLDAWPTPSTNDDDDVG